MSRMIQCQNISLAFNRVSLFENFSFGIKKGKKVCISGPSGKGKSSLLKMLMGFVMPSSGNIKINGLPITAQNIDLIRKEISWLPQNIHLPVNSGLELSNMLNQSAVLQNRIPSYLDQLGLPPDYFHKDLNEVSGGQKQRIVLAVCLSLNKPILLLDEPTSALDDLAIDQLIETLFSFTDLTVVSASHNRKWMDRCHKIIEL